ncbi:MAG: hypothetical protein R3321_11005, partial [Nitrososphaeraceae archaeon]|nr:hypothetical protein [Nitrososphaeraceae archaeon]
FKPDAKNLLYNAKVDYTGISGLRFGASYIYNNANGDSTENKIGLVEFHAKYNANNAIAVFEIGNISYGSGEIEASMGYYFDIGYNIGSLFNIESKIIPFFRYSDINTASQTISGGDLEKMYHNTLWMAGFSFLPIDQVVFKFDYSEKTLKLGNVKTQSYNLGVGYMF